jgi:ectoine hydroxylase-related dioxygenase (phytanoyl-CoA dioxygenase family)
MTATSEQTSAFRQFHEVVLPQRLAAGNGALAYADAARMGPLAVRVGDLAYTYEPVDGTVAVRRGDAAAATVVELGPESWAGLAADLDTAPGLLYGGRVEVRRGNPLRFVRWEPALRAMFHGRPIFDPASVDLRDRSGRPLDTSRAFAFDEVSSHAEDARHFLATAGYILVRDVFDEQEVEAFLADARQVESEAREGDQESWWGKDEEGRTVLCRVLRGGSRPRLQALYEDARVNALVALAREDLSPKEREETDGVTVLWKRPGVKEGLSDLPWHRDCGMGGHALNCPSAVMTICLTDGSEAAGELRVLPGSHEASYPFIDGTDEQAPRGVSLAARRGDVSLHYTDVMHASMPPSSAQGPHRISVLLGFCPPDAGHHLSERHYNDVLLGRDDGQVEHLVDRVKRRRS